MGGVYNQGRVRVFVTIEIEGGNTKKYLSVSEHPHKNISDILLLNLKNLY